MSQLLPQNIEFSDYNPEYAKLYHEDNNELPSLTHLTSSYRPQ